MDKFAEPSVGTQYKCLKFNSIDFLLGVSVFLTVPTRRYIFL
jgi:hypothetical protein